MSKKTPSVILSDDLADKLAGVGGRIRAARMSRGVSLARLSDEAGCSELTLIRVERGAATVAMGTYARVLQALGLADDLDMIASLERGAAVGVEARSRRGRKRKDA